MPVLAVLTQPQGRQCPIRAYQQSQSNRPSRALFIVIADNVEAGRRADKAKGFKAKSPLSFYAGHIQALAPWLWRLKSYQQNSEEEPNSLLMSK
jgi:hypothetical protein